MSFILSQVRQIHKKRATAGDDSHRSFTMLYHIKDVQVCKSFFLKVLQISENVVYRAIEKSKNLEFRDGRGKHSNHRRRTAEDGMVVKLESVEVLKTEIITEEEAEEYVE